MAELLPKRKHDKQIQNLGRLGTQPPEILHLVRQLAEKKPERKRKNLIQLGIERGLAYAYSRTRKGGWAVAQSPILGTTITLARLAKRGYESMVEYYQKVSPKFNEPLYPPAGGRTVV